MSSWIVSPEDKGITLAQFLQRKHPFVSIRKMKAQLDVKGCLHNGRQEFFSSKKVRVGDTVAYLADIKEAPTLEILYEDDRFLCCNKPCFINSVDNGVYEMLKKERPTLLLVHRLDRDTSGVLLFAKDREAQKFLEESFKNKEIRKEYLCLVKGHPKHEEGTISFQMGRLENPAGTIQWGRVDGGLLATTQWRLHQKGKGYSLLLCYPKTGRTHQIRVQMASIGLPILGDRIYGLRQALAPRQMLHANRLTWFHPDLNKEITIEAPLPLDFKKTMHSLGGFG